jgi:hypothetical protein
MSFNPLERQSTRVLLLQSGADAAAVEDCVGVFTNRADHSGPMTGDDRTT